MRIMEKIWEELRKIEKEADLIRSEALGKSKQIIMIARAESEKLISDSKIQMNEEADELLKRFREAIRKESEDALEKNEEFVKELRKSAEKRIDEAVKTIFDVVLRTD